eukprot:COSAG02_NODE_90_length_37755_cov_29.833364_2_plen_47_part_00
MGELNVVGREGDSEGKTRVFVCSCRAIPCWMRLGEQLNLRGKKSCS